MNFETLAPANPASDRSPAIGLKRGLRELCPNCGEGHLYRSYLKIDQTCSVCGHENGAYRADDGPAYFTILLVGHLIVGPMLCFQFIRSLPTELALAAILPPIVLATLLLLPRVKGAVIGMMWATRNTGAN